MVIINIINMLAVKLFLSRELLLVITFYLPGYAQLPRILQASFHLPSCHYRALSTVTVFGEKGS